MTRDERDMFLEIEKRYEREYECQAKEIVEELIARSYSESRDRRYMTFKEYCIHAIGIRFSELHFNAFAALVCRMAVKQGFVVVGLPYIDITHSDPCNIVVTDYRLRAVPIGTIKRE